MNFAIRLFSRCCECDKRIVSIYLKTEEFTKEELIEHELCIKCNYKRMLKS